MKSPAVVACPGTWMNINEHKWWLRRAVCPNGQTHWKEGFQSAVSALRREVQKSIRRELDPAAALRSTLNLSEDEGDETPKKPSCGMPKTAAAHVEIELMGYKMKMKTSMRPLYVAVTQDSVNGIISFCKDHIAKGQWKLKRDTTAKNVSAACPQSWSMPEDPCPAILGKVTWQASHCSWSIHGKNENKENFVKRLKVDVEKKKKGFLAGGVTPGDTKQAFQDERRKQYLAAIKMWNNEDQSTRERIDVPEG